MREAQKRGFDGIVLVIDEDGQSERRQQIDEAQDYSGTAIPRALGVAIRTFDAWMLTDEKALSKVFGITIRRQPDPEKITDPKKGIDELRDASMVDMRRGELYARIASEAAMESIETRCSKGFAPFAKRVREL